MRWSDARTIFQLLADLRDVGDEPAAWREHLLGELSRVVGARVALATEHRPDPARYGGEVLGLCHVGWENERERDVFCVLRGDPTERAMAAHLQRSHTFARHELVRDDDWQRSEFGHSLARVAGLDRFILSQQVLPERDVVSSIALYRSVGERPFSPREQTFVDRLHRELALAWRAPDPRLALPRRLRQTLSELCAGRSEKEIADALQLSQHTVHQYVTMLYRRFDVRSRPELLARARTTRRRPLLSVELL